MSADRIDTTELGKLTAALMDALEPAGEYGEELAGGRLASVLIVVEVLTDEEADGRATSTVIARVTDGRNVLALGLIERGREALLTPDD